MDLKKLEKLVEQRYLSCRKHPDADLLIWNYTAKTQYEGFWNEETIMCRGLITDLKGNVKARPFRKFFNVGEREENIPRGDFKTYKKLDGSLGILYWVDDTPFIATRGSFESEQSKVGTEMLKNYKTDDLDRSKTYLFEIIYPKNRIVVDYGDRKELHLLDVLDTATGERGNLSGTDFPTVRELNLSVEEMEKNQKDNEEGYVLVWQNGFRLKFKFDEYKRIHKIVTGVTSRRIWEVLSAGESMDPFLERVPDEFYSWVKKITKGLISKHTKTHKACKNAVSVAVDTIAIDNAHGKVIDYKVFNKIKSDYSRKVEELFRSLQPNSVDVCWQMYYKSGKNYKEAASKLIWKSLKPAHETPFKTNL